MSLIGSPSRATKTMRRNAANARPACILCGSLRRDAITRYVVYLYILATKT